MGKSAFREKDRTEIMAFEIIVITREKTCDSCV